MLPRTLFVNHTSKLGGGEQILLSVLHAFGSESALWLFQDGPVRDEVLKQVAVRPILPRRPTGLSAIKRDRNLLLAAGPLLREMAGMVAGIARAAQPFDVVYANSQKAFVLSAVAAKLARKPLVWHLHDILIPAHFGAGQLRLLRLLAPLASRIIVPSTAAAEALRALGAGGNRVRVVPNGVDIAPDPLGPADRKALRATFGVPPDAMLVGVFSRLSPWKGQAEAVRAIALRPGAYCLLAGDALFGETEYVDMLRRLVADLGLGDRVRFLGHRGDVPDLMRMVDVMVHPSLDPEPFGRTLVEAMLCGTPVVATDAGAAREILADGAAGLLVRPGSPEEIAKALAAIADDPKATEARVARGRLRALDAYTEQAMRARVAAVVTETRRDVP